MGRIGCTTNSVGVLLLSQKLIVPSPWELEAQALIGGFVVHSSSDVRDDWFGSEKQLSADAGICNSSSIALDAGAGFSLYAWAIGTTNQSLLVSQYVSYTVAVIPCNPIRQQQQVKRRLDHRKGAPNPRRIGHKMAVQAKLRDGNRRRCFARGLPNVVPITSTTAFMPTEIP
jgi:hypothetical protein